MKPRETASYKSQDAPVRLPRPRRRTVCSPRWTYNGTGHAVDLTSPVPLAPHPTSGCHAWVTSANCSTSKLRGAYDPYCASWLFDSNPIVTDAENKSYINTDPNEKRGKTRSRTGQRICHSNAPFLPRPPRAARERPCYILPERRPRIFQHTIHARLFMRMCLQEVMLAP